MSGCREILPGPRLWHFPDLLTFIWKYVFLNNSDALKDFRKNFYGNVRMSVSICFSQITEKSIFFGLWRWEVTLTFLKLSCDEISIRTRSEHFEQ